MKPLYELGEMGRRNQEIQFELQEKFSLPNSSRDITETQEFDSVTHNLREHHLRWKEWRQVKTFEPVDRLTYMVDKWVACEWDILRNQMSSEDGSPILYPPSINPIAKVDYITPEKHGVVTVRNCSAQEAFSVANTAVEEYFRDDETVRRYGLEPIPTSDTDGQFDFSFFVYR